MPRFARSEVVLCTVKLLAKARSEVKFTHHFAKRRNFTHEVNFTIEDNFTCREANLVLACSVKDHALISYYRKAF